MSKISLCCSKLEKCSFSFTIQKPFGNFLVKLMLSKNAPCYSGKLTAVMLYQWKYTIMV